MIAFVCTSPSIRITLWVAMVTMHFHKDQMSLYFGTFFFRVQGVPGNNLAPIYVPVMLRSSYLLTNEGYARHELFFFLNCPGVQGRSN